MNTYVRLPNALVRSSYIFVALVRSERRPRSTAHPIMATALADSQPGESCLTASSFLRSKFWVLS